MPRVVSSKTQLEKLVALMQENEDLARGVCPKNVALDRWATIARELNSIGPPVRSDDIWLKVWKDLKYKTKKKMLHNRKELIATGARRSNFVNLSSMEEAISRIMDFDAYINPPGLDIFSGQDQNRSSHSDDVRVIEAVSPPASTSKQCKRKYIKHKHRTLERGNYKNSRQEKIIVNFMESYPDLAQGLSKDTKSEYDALWLTLTQELNNAGPPEKDDFHWKKTWSDWKDNIKNKIKTKHATELHSDPIYSIKLSKAEEIVARICNLYKVNESLDFSSQCLCSNTGSSYDDESLMNNVLSEETSTTTQEHAKQNGNINFGQANLPHGFKNQIGSNESIVNNDFSKCLGDIAANAMIGSSTEIVQNIADSLDGLCMLYAEAIKESSRHNRAVEDLMREKNSIKMRSLELQELQYKMIKEKQENELIRAGKM